MRRLEDIVILDEKTLRALDRKIDYEIHDMEKHPIDFNLLQYVLEEMTRNQQIRRTSYVDKIVPIKREEMLAVTLDFFKSIDEEFYRQAIDVIMNKNEKLKMYIYNAHLAQKTEQKDENGISMYSATPCIESNNGHTNVLIPLQYGISKEHASKLLDKNSGTLNDLYSIVHEISHLFDHDEDVRGVPTTEEIIEGKEHQRPESQINSDLLVEATAATFEGLLTNYLLERGLYPRAAVTDIAISRMHNSIYKARIACAEVTLANIKRKKGEITNDDIENLMNKHRMSVPYVRQTARRIIDDKKTVMYKNRYAIAGLIAPTIISEVEQKGENGVECLKRYLKASHDNDFDGALMALGIEKTPEGLRKIVGKMNSRMTWLQNQRGYKIDERGLI